MKPEKWAQRGTCRVTVQRRRKEARSKAGEEWRGQTNEGRALYQKRNEQAKIGATRARERARQAPTENDRQKSVARKEHARPHVQLHEDNSVKHQSGARKQKYNARFTYMRKT